ncbi:hypothetical protein [Prochlorococcus marinus]|uniref:hypothetical protein n=1 Tax=Prochlorococcus marinus TaxID=1219 RepID=UPI001181A45B|nr:hypothetical protein [Prochlorococcus marinus]
MKRSIVDTEIPSRSDTSFMLKNGRFGAFMWWRYGGENAQIFYFFISYSVRDYQEILIRFPLGELYFQVPKTSSYST